MECTNVWRSSTGTRLVAKFRMLRRYIAGRNFTSVVPGTNWRGSAMNAGCFMGQKTQDGLGWALWLLTDAAPASSMSVRGIMGIDYRHSTAPEYADFSVPAGPLSAKSVAPESFRARMDAITARREEVATDAGSKHGRIRTFKKFQTGLLRGKLSDAAGMRAAPCWRRGAMSAAD